MRDPDAPMIPFEEALRLVDEACAGRMAGTEVAPVRGSLGRVLRSEPRARLALPPFDKSAVDGFAISGEIPAAAAPGGSGPDGPDGPGHLAEPEQLEAGLYRIAGIVQAGDAPPPPLSPGTAVRVMTGAPVPAGAARVVMLEHTEVSRDQVRVLRHSAGRNICYQGEDVRPGDLVLPAGAILRPLELAILVSAGIAEVEVARRIRLAILSTGNEIVDDPEEIVPGRIMNSNGPMLSALANAPWLERVEERRVPDDPAATREAIASALALADLVLLSGGVSEGDSDFVIPALASLGARPLFTRVAVKPGKPLTFAAHPDGLILGLPGNPLSAYLMFHLVALRIASRLAGARPPDDAVRLALAAPFRRGNASRLEFVPARLAPEGRVEPVPYHGSAHLSALARAGGFFAVPAGVIDLAAGREVEFHPIGGALRP